MNRRSFISCISVGAICSVAGCASSGGCSGIHVNFHAVDAEEIALQVASDLDDTPRMMTDLAIQTAEGDEPMVETIHGGPLSWLTYLDWDGQFYKINEEVVNRGRVSGPEYVLSRDSETEDLSPDDPLSFANLPRHDQWRVSETADYNVEGLGEMGFSISFIAGYLDQTDQEESVLATGVENSVIEADGSVAELKRTGEGDDIAQQLRYTVEPVFKDVSSFSEYVLDRRGSTSFDPSDEVRTLLDEAKENNGHLTICDQDTSENEDEETAERRRNAASELKMMFTSLEEASDREGGSDSEPLEYVRYEGDWHYIDVYRSQGV